MPKQETSNPNDGPSFQAPRYRPNWLAGLICFAVGTFLLVALVAYDPAQSAWSGTGPLLKNPAGKLGANAIWILLSFVGVSTILTPLFLLWMLYVSVRSSKHLTGTRSVAIIIAMVSLAGVAAMFDTMKWGSDPLKWGSDYFPHGFGGVIGSWLYHRLLAEALGPFGSGLILGTIYCGSQLFIFTKDMSAEFEKIFTNFGAWRAERAKLAAERDEQKRKAKEAKAKQKSAAAVVVATSTGNTNPPTPVGPTGKKTFVPKSTEDPLAKAAAKPAVEPAAKPVVAAPPPSRPEAKTQPPLKVAAKPAEPASAPKPAVAPNIVMPEVTKKAKITQIPSDNTGYKFPPHSLLQEQVRAAADSADEYNKNMADLVRILGEFDVEVTAGDIQVGPVITRYEVAPAPGVRVEKISGLDKNIALGMRAQSVRILAPIPGKAAVGVEVPNQKATPVGLREIIESEEWAGARELPIALGKDVSGKPLVSDLTKMPHLLIAGATGSGKSVCINAIVASIIYSKSPKDVRLIMVDPKVVELKIFNDLPHMLIPVVTEAKKVPAALKILLRKMEERYQLFAKVNVRNITGFNSRTKNGVSPTPDAQTEFPAGDRPTVDEMEVPDRLPYIVAIIDELADLMMVAPAEIETSIARLAQLARAAGIHLIIATQRPSVNVITGVIKANLPSRIAFQVASQVDSRTILDGKGAETLIGRGDMLFTPPGTSKLVRAQGAFVSDKEVQDIVDNLKKNNEPPIYDQSVQAEIDRAAKEADDEEAGGEEDGDMGDDGELYEQAIGVLRSTRKASTSMLQRRLRIGYNRAARIMELMEEKGIVGPENGSSPRDILVDLDSL